MPRRLIDLSVPIEMGVASDPPMTTPKIQYFKHGETVGQMRAAFPGLEAADLPDEEGWAVERIDISTHNGTHMDAPWHFHSTQDAELPGGARPSLTIDETPLDYCFGPGVKLDFRHLEDGHVVQPAEIDAELARIGHRLRPLDIVLVNTAAGARYGQPDYLDRGCGMGRAATLHLTRQGVRVVGIDGWSWDAPFSLTARRWAATRDASLIWEGHKAGREIGYWQMEKLHNLEALPSTGFQVCCFPVKIRAASAGWVRAVGVVDD